MEIKQSDRENNLAWNYLKKYIQYASLNVLGMLGLSCYILADTFFISKGLGANGLTALNLAIPVYNVVHGSSLMLGIGGATKYTIHRSRKEATKANAVFTNVMALTLIMALLFLSLGIFGSEYITAFLGANTKVFAMTNIYLKVILLFSPTFMINDIYICFVRTDGNPKLSMFAMLIGSMANIVLDCILIFPMRMGIFGAVLATGFAPLISLLLLSMHCLKKQNKFHFIKRRLGPKKIAEILSLGLPSLVTEISSGIVIVVFNMMILVLKGNVGVAAYGVIANLSLVVIAVFTGIAQGIQPLLSRAHGYHDKKNMISVLRYGLVTMLVLSGAVYLLIFFMADPITAIFNSENNIHLQKIAADGLKLYFTAMPFAGANIILSIFFTSMERAAPAHVISLLRGLFLMVPMTILLAVLWGMKGVWISYPATEGLVAVLGMGIYFLWRKSSMSVSK